MNYHQRASDCFMTVRFSIPLRPHSSQHIRVVNFGVCFYVNINVLKDFSKCRSPCHLSHTNSVANSYLRFQVRRFQVRRFQVPQTICLTRYPLYGGVRIANSALRQLRATPYTGGVRFWSEAAIQIRSPTAARYSLYGRCSFLVGSGDPDLLSDSCALLPKRAVLVHGQKRRS